MDRTKEINFFKAGWVDDVASKWTKIDLDMFYQQQMTFILNMSAPEESKDKMRTTWENFRNSASKLIERRMRVNGKKEKIEAMKVKINGLNEEMTSKMEERRNRSNRIKDKKNKVGLLKAEIRRHSESAAYLSEDNMKLKVDIERLEMKKAEKMERTEQALAASREQFNEMKILFDNDAGLKKKHEKDQEVNVKVAELSKLEDVAKKMKAEEAEMEEELAGRVELPLTEFCVRFAKLNLRLINHQKKYDAIEPQYLALLEQKKMSATQDADLDATLNFSPNSQNSQPDQSQLPKSQSKQTGSQTSSQILPPSMKQKSKSKSPAQSQAVQSQRLSQDPPASTQAEVDKAKMEAVKNYVNEQASSVAVAKKTPTRESRHVMPQLSSNNEVDGSTNSTNISKSRDGSDGDGIISDIEVQSIVDEPQTRPSALIDDGDATMDENEGPSQPQNLSQKKDPNLAERTCPTNGDSGKQHHDNENQDHYEDNEENEASMDNEQEEENEEQPMEDAEASFDEGVGMEERQDEGTLRSQENEIEHGQEAASQSQSGSQQHSQPSQGSKEGTQKSANNSLNFGSQGVGDGVENGDNVNDMLFGGVDENTQENGEAGNSVFNFNTSGDGPGFFDGLETSDKGDGGSQQAGVPSFLFGGNDDDAAAVLNLSANNDGGASFLAFMEGNDGAGDAGGGGDDAAGSFNFNFGDFGGGEDAANTSGGGFNFDFGGDSPSKEGEGGGDNDFGSFNFGF